MSSFATKQLRRWSQNNNIHFNEIFSPDGQYRSPYAEVMPVFKRIFDKNPHRIKKFATMSFKAFNKDNTLYHLPRMLSQDEYSLLYAGVQQRARAMQSFINDHYFNQKSYLQEKLISKNTIDQIISRSCEDKFQKKVDKYGIKQYGFWYGPDIIRGPDGKFYVCEDNLGFVGGLGDLIVSQNILVKEFPEYAPLIEKHSMKDIYTEMIDSYRRMIKSGEVIVFLYYPRSVRADHEEQRIIKELESLNVYCVILPDGKSRSDRRSSWHLEVDAHRHVFITKGATRLSVGLVILDCEAYDSDPKNSTVRQKVVVDEAEWLLELYSDTINRLIKKGGIKYKEIKSQYNDLSKMINLVRESPNKRNFRNLNSFLKKHHHKDFNMALSRGVPGLLRAYFDGNVKLINGPGFDFLGDKLFCPYLNTLIRHYLKEEPILRTIPTMSFNKYPELVSLVFDNPKIQQHVVIKSVNGRGGSEVWVGAKISRSKFLSVKEQIQKSPSRFLVQQYIPLSQVDNQLVDLRVICSVSSSDIVILPTFWGRGVPIKNSNGKVNISDTGFEFAVCQSRNRSYRP